jgi:cytochrome b561
MTMTPETGPGRQDSRATLLGWALFISFFALFWNIILLPRTALDQRDFLRGIHDSLGLIVILLAGLRLLAATRWPAPQAPRNLPAASFSFNRITLIAIYITLAVNGLVGFLYAWAEGRDVVVFGLVVPQLVQSGESLRMTTGYLHSSLGFYYMMLFTIWIAYGMYQHFRYRVGLLRLLPGSRV